MPQLGSRSLDRFIHPCLLLLWDIVAAPNVEDVVKCAISLDPESTDRGAFWLACANTRGVGATARGRVWVGRRGERDCEERGEEVEFHVDGKAYSRQGFFRK
jgi:hypothetical protein